MSTTTTTTTTTFAAAAAAAACSRGYLEGESMSTMVGTSYYIAPEVGVHCAPRFIVTLGFFAPLLSCGFRDRGGGSRFA